MRRSDQHLGPPAPLPLSFDIDGHTYTLPPLDTRTWLDALVLDTPACWWQLVPGRLADNGAYQLYQRVTSAHDELDLDQVEHVAESVLGRVLGMDFHAGRRLAASAYANWLLFDGWCWTRGVDPLEQPIGRLVAAVYTWRRSLCSKESELQRLDGDIWAPPPASTVTGQPRDPTPPNWSDEAEAASFMQAMTSLGG